jgi:NTP pyrophosphatase (non-canonical NTP hydrolase)
MTIKQYQQSTNRTNAPLGAIYNHMTELHMLMGMMTEVGELVDVYKKNLAYSKPIDLVNVKEEIGDLMWYISEFCNHNGFDLEQILQLNIDKLKSRFPEKFDAFQAINRDLGSERDILEHNALDTKPYFSEKNVTVSW